MPQSERAPSLREVNIESRRRRILEAARCLIARGGMQALSMRKLAAESGLAVTKNQITFPLFSVSLMKLAIIEKMR